MTQKQLDRIATGSKRFTWEGSVFTIYDYYDSRNYIQIDLAKLTPDLLAELAPEPEDDEWQDEPYC